MAKTFLAEIAPTPVNMTATPMAGGSLDIGKTYYYRIVHVGPGNNYYQGNGAQWWRSVPCVEFSATTDAVNRTIRLAWDKDLVDTAVVLVFRSEVSGDYTVYDRATDTWTQKQLDLGIGARAEGITIGNLIDLGAQWGLDDSGSYVMRYGPVIESGVPRITIGGGDASDPITPTNIADWMVVNGYASCVDILNYFENVKEPVVIKMRATIQNTGVTYFGISPRQHFIQEWGKFWFDANGHVIIGDRNVGEPNNGAIWQILGAYAWYSGFQGELEMNDTVVWSTPSYLATNLVNTGGLGSMFHLYNGDNPCGFYSSIYIPSERGKRGRLSPTNLVLSNSIMKIQGAELKSSRADFVGCQISNALNLAFNMRQLTFIECFTSLTNTYDLLNQNYYTIDSCALFIDCSFVGSGSDGILPSINKYFNAAVSSWMDTMILKSIALSVVDENGNAMVGAAMTIKDSSSDYDVNFVRLDSYVANAVYTGTALTVTDASEISIGDVLRLNREKVLVTGKSGVDLTIERQYEGSPLRSTDHVNGGCQIYLRKTFTSDINGSFDKIYVMHDYHSVQQDGSSGYHMYYPADYTSVNPITITISKAGYWDYEVEFDLENPVIDTIGMKPLSDFLAAVPIEVEVGNPNIEVTIEKAEVTVEIEAPSVDVTIQETDIEVTVEKPDIDVEVGCG